MAITNDATRDDTLQTIKEGKVTDQGPHGRDWGPQEEFIGDSLRMFPKEYGAGLSSGRAEPVRWPFVLGAILGGALLALVSLRRRDRSAAYDNKLDELI